MKLKLVKSKILDYPSGSALEFFHDQLFLIGDDSAELLVLDVDFNIVNRMQVFKSDNLRIPKKIKPDFECATVVNDELFIFGSGSLSPNRNRGFIFNDDAKAFKEFDLSIVYNKFKSFSDVKEVNIEGLTLCHESLLFFNRANLNQKNSLLVVDTKAFLSGDITTVKLLPIEIGHYRGVPMGISGAHYDHELDILYVSASAEATENSFDDGEIIGSGIAMISNAFLKIKTCNKLVFDQFIDLAEIDNQFEKQKIESICIQKNINSEDIIYLVADNDDGKSVLFEVLIKN